jgi:AcrR family transcriptional regulator
MSRITQELKTETKDNIIKAATLLFQKNGFDKTKTKAIAQACNIAEGTLFNYFPTKDDLLIAVFENMAKSVDHFDTNQLPNVLEQLIYFSLEPIKQMHKIPKSLLLDLLISSIKIAKKKPKLFNKLAELDIKYIDKLKDKLDIYGDFSNKEITSKDLAEMIYSIVATDFMLYLYQNAENYEDYVNKIKPKLKVLIKPYLKEVIR